MSGLSAANQRPRGRRQVSGGEPCSHARARAAGVPVSHAPRGSRAWICSRGIEETRRRWRLFIEVPAKFDSAVPESRGRSANRFGAMVSRSIIDSWKSLARGNLGRLLLNKHKQYFFFFHFLKKWTFFLRGCVNY